ncbi:MAG: NAD-dependent epimerase/dehydratase family protein [Vibrio gallaecicus]|uniref:NAD-dependent epimerase/dehydratase family protein n=1 Tax=Vibrio gallaecicus TaxID=552386 RepID=A0ABV4NI05_9VIBR
MTISGDNTSVIIAGASGLIGGHALKLLVIEPAISHVYALSRSSLFDSSIDQSKLTNIINADLHINQWEDTLPPPTLGLICLGTTLKQAGSKEALRKVDVELVCEVAQTMKLLGVERVAVVSSYGASTQSYSHYLRCKGNMEQNLMRMGFKQVLFMRPGPLTGERKQSRSDEQLLQKLMPIFSPFLLGKFKNLRPIAAYDVAQAMLFKLFEINYHPIEMYDSTEMLNLLSKYR